MEVIKTITLILYMGGDVAEHTAFEQIAKCLKANQLLYGMLVKIKLLRYHRTQMAQIIL